MKIKRGQIFLNNTCKLNCTFCINSLIKNKNTDYQFPWEGTDHVSVINFELFKQSMNFLTEMGVSIIELGTTIGEPLEHNMTQLREIFETLDDCNDVTDYFFYTNLVELTDEHISLFNETKKLNIRVSCYGLSRDQFKKRTGHDLFNTFMSNLNKLHQIRTTNRTFNVRVEVRATATEMSERVGMERIKHISNKSSDDVNMKLKIVDSDHNWKRTIDWEKLEDNGVPPPKRAGCCEFIPHDVGVLSNGDVSLCAWLDVYGTNILGNVKTSTPAQVQSTLDQIIAKQNEGVFSKTCKYCDFYRPLNDS